MAFGRSRWDSNPQSPAPEASALSIRPREPRCGNLETRRTPNQNRTKLKYYIAPPHNVFSTAAAAAASSLASALFLSLSLKMALAISNIVLCAKSLNSSRTRSLRQTLLPNSPSSLNRLFWKTSKSKMVVHCAASAAGSPGQNGDVSPYEILGVNPIEGFDMVKAAYTRKRRDALTRGDDALLSQLERAYDKIMMAQLSNRKQGVTYGSFQVSKDIKYADKQPVVPWAPRFTKSSVNDMRINLAISAVFTAWIFIKRYAEWKPLQFLAFVFVYRIFEKLKAFEPPVSPTATEDGEDEGRALRMGKRLVRSLALVFGCIALASLGFTGILNIIEFVGGYIPAFLYNNQELIVTAASAVMCYIMASYYR